MKKNILVNVSISCDPPRVPYYISKLGNEKIAKYYESWVKDFEDFMRDHRSQDPVSLEVNYEYKDVCSHCGYDWEEENGLPMCCDKAQEEFINKGK